MSQRWQSVLVAHGALVFLAGMAAGFPFAFVILQKIALWPLPDVAWAPPGDVRGWRMAHLEGILNGLTLLAVAACARLVTLGPRAQAWVVWGLILTAWGNMVASFIAPLFGVRGLEAGGGVANTVVFALFMVAVVAVIAAMALVARGALAAARVARS